MGVIVVALVSLVPVVVILFSYFKYVYVFVGFILFKQNLFDDSVKDELACPS